MWLSAGLEEWVAFGHGYATTAGFRDYEFPSISEIPEIEVYAIKDLERRGGVDEPGLLSVAQR